MTTTVRRVLSGLSISLTMTLLATAQQPMPRTTKQSIAGASTVKTEHLRGTVIAVEGNHLAVRMATGALRSFDVPAERRFIVDGKELTVGELKPGTRLTATVTTTTTPMTDRTTTVGTGKVWYVAGTTVILTLPNNENRMYKVADSYRFMVNGEPATVFELKKGMVVSAQKIVEEPRTEIASNVAVTGQAPPPPTPRVAQTPPPSPPKAEPVQVAAAPRPAPAPSPVQAERTAPAPAQLPRTASQLPLAGILGLLSIAGSMFMRKVRRSN